MLSLIPTIMSMLLIKSLLCFLMMNYSAENYEVSNFPLKKRLFNIELSFVLHFKIFLYVKFYQHGFLVQSWCIPLGCPSGQEVENCEWPQRFQYC